MDTVTPTTTDRAELGDAAPVIELRFVGNGRAFCRAIARNIVRRELISAGLIADPDRCEPEALAG